MGGCCHLQRPPKSGHCRLGGGGGGGIAWAGREWQPNMQHTVMYNNKKRSKRYQLSNYNHDRGRHITSCDISELYVLSINTKLAVFISDLYCIR